jgi:hypothetical protein
MNDETEQDELLAWQPPELVERARTYARREAQSAEKRALAQEKRGKRTHGAGPAGKRPGLSLGLLCASAALLIAVLALNLAGPWAGEARANRGAAGNVLYAAVGALWLLACALFLLPWPESKAQGRKAALTVLFGLQTAAVAAMGVLQLLAGSAEAAARAGQVVFGAALLLLLSPGLWLLIGLLCGRSFERLAALVQVIVALIGLTALKRNPVPNLVVLLQGLVFAAFLLTWPVLTRPVRIAKGKQAPSRSDATEKTGGDV